eukprot:TRINITY_DN2866_c0_g1_i10.p5 TRINITY_DN2866_c0_g1~~TRINITY_DN2866_c0_g1_i10.p5  ORF type:complete len:165 (-),score=34.87 TRINITY_DN2866_c0_g1_i10:103-597(-)
MSTTAGGQELREASGSSLDAGGGCAWTRITRFRFIDSASWWIVKTLLPPPIRVPTIPPCRREALEDGAALEDEDELPEAALEDDVGASAALEDELPDAALNSAASAALDEDELPEAALDDDGAAAIEDELIETALNGAVDAALDLKTLGRAARGRAQQRRECRT